MRANVKLQFGIRIARTECALNAAYVVKYNLADVVIIKSGTDVKDLKHVMALLGGARDSGPFDTIRDIRVDLSKSKSVAESSAGHPLHTDGSFEVNPPKLFLLQVVESDEGSGGLSTFVGIPSMLKVMPDDLRASFSAADVAFSRADDSGRFDASVGPVIHLRMDGSKGFRWRNDDQVSPQVINANDTKIVEAIGWVKGYLAATLPVTIAGQPGEIIVVNNDLVLHGRTVLSTLDSRRWVRRAWLGEMTPSQ